MGGGPGAFTPEGQADGMKGTRVVTALGSPAQARLPRRATPASTEIGRIARSWFNRIETLHPRARISPSEDRSAWASGLMG